MHARVREKKESVPALSMLMANGMSSGVRSRGYYTRPSIEQKTRKKNEGASGKNGRGSHASYLMRAKILFLSNRIPLPTYTHTHIHTSTHRGRVSYRYTFLPFCLFAHVQRAHIPVRNNYRNKRTVVGFCSSSLESDGDGDGARARSWKESFAWIYSLDDLVVLQKKCLLLTQCQLF